jgi:hypothetical protein
MPGTDFSKYHTYKWVTIGGGEQAHRWTLTTTPTRHFTAKR